MELPVKKNLVYFIYWDPTNKMLDLNLRLLKKYIKLFDGVIVIQIAIEANRLIEVPEWLYDVGFQIVKNDPVYGEKTHFIHALTKLPFSDNSITFYAHAKGVSREVNRALLSWVYLSYKTNLEHIPTLSEKVLFSGSFKKTRQASTQVPLQWHYSGSFYWFKTKEVMDRYCSKEIPEEINTRWFTECFPAFIANSEEAAVAFYENPGKCNLYSEKFWLQDYKLIRLLLNEIPNS